MVSPLVPTALAVLAAAVSVPEASDESVEV
jgi:hypothetical protein